MHGTIFFYPKDMMEYNKSSQNDSIIENATHFTFICGVLLTKCN